MMKSFRLLSTLAVILVLAFTAFTAHAQDNSAFPSEFQYASYWNKLAPEVQKAWNDAKASGNMDQRIDCFVASRDVASGNQDFLFSAGFSTQVASGNSARGHMLIKNLPNVAAQPFVRRIDLAKPAGN